MRKAAALIQYVTCMEEYAIGDDEVDETSTSANVTEDVVTALLPLQTTGLLALPSPLNLPAGPIPSALVRSHKYVTLFSKLKSHLIGELGACGDSTLMSRNQNILQTVSQVVDLETLEISNFFQSLQNEQTSQAFEAATTNTSCPRSFICPITLEIMKQPCIAMDGHSYERAALEEWFLHNNTSPVTNLPLPSKSVIDNHSLRSAISQYMDGLHGKNTADSSHQESPSIPASTSVGFHRLMRPARRPGKRAPKKGNRR